jgi:hypothetical protein
MTEAEWLAYADPDPFRRWTHPMLVFLESIGRASERKLRLFAVACCRLLLSKVRVHPQDEHLVHLAERYAEGPPPPNSGGPTTIPQPPGYRSFPPSRPANSSLP